MLLKTRIHLKERSYPIYLGHIYRKLWPPSSSLTIASYLYNADITRVLKQANNILKLFFYLKLLYEANSVQHRNMKFTSSQPSRAHYNPAIIYFTSTSKNLTQFVKVLLVKLSDMLHSSNFVRLFHRQSFALYGNNIVLICILYVYCIYSIVYISKYY